jgi:hypothetical protein
MKRGLRSRADYTGVFVSGGAYRANRRTRTSEPVGVSSVQATSVAPAVAAIAG